VQTEIDQIEYKLEKALEAAKIRGWLEGEWIGEGSMGSMGVFMGFWPFHFVVKSDSIYVYFPSTFNDINEVGGNAFFTDYETISVKQEGKKIQFAIELKERIRERGSWSTLSNTKAQFILNLIAPDRMEGTIVFSAKIYNSDGRADLRTNVTVKATFNKRKHSSNSILKLYGL